MEISRKSPGQRLTGEANRIRYILYQVGKILTTSYWTMFLKLSLIFILIATANHIYHRVESCFRAFMHLVRPVRYLSIILLLVTLFQVTNNCFLVPISNGSFNRWQLGLNWLCRRLRKGIKAQGILVQFSSTRLHTTRLHFQYSQLNFHTPLQQTRPDCLLCAHFLQFSLLFLQRLRSFKPL